MNDTSGPWGIVPQPGGQWLVKRPSIHIKMAPGVIGTKCGRCIGVAAKEADARQIANCLNACEGMPDSVLVAKTQSLEKRNVK